MIAPPTASITAAEVITMPARSRDVSDPSGRLWGRGPFRNGGSLTPRLLICGGFVGGKHRRRTRTLSLRRGFRNSNDSKGWYGHARRRDVGERHRASAGHAQGEGGSGAHDATSRPTSSRRSVRVTR